jgi:drug/metabolite transporter (DMT)-like permease
LSLIWGLNVLVMKWGISDYPPFLFRGFSIALGLFVVYVFIVATKRSIFVPLEERWTVFKIAMFTMVLWQLALVVGLIFLTSGRAAIIGYTMPAWAYLASNLIYKSRFTFSGSIAAISAFIATLLLTIAEFEAIRNFPTGAVAMLLGAMSWGLGTATANNQKISVENTVVTFWSLTLALILFVFLFMALEWSQFRWPSYGETLAIVYGGVLSLGICYLAWYSLARALPAVVSSLSIMLVPIISLFGGALVFGDQIYIEDWIGLILILFAMGMIFYQKKLGKD